MHPSTASAPELPKNMIREGRLAEQFCEGGLLRDVVETRRVPQGPYLILQGLHQFWMRMAERIDGNTRPKVKESSAVRRNQINAFTLFECDIGPPVGGHDGCVHGLASCHKN